MLKSTPTCPLPDIREARIDPTLPVNERLRLFAAAIGDPHRFRVGDTEVDIATARNAGMDCIAVDWGFRDRDVLVGAGAGIICDDTDALYRALREG